ncbi:hypothetical protein [Microbacterium caowuchunii]|nr:hypothetical protein [Microbacterium caowuchunii]
MNEPSAHHIAAPPRRVRPGDIELPSTEPIDISALIAAELSAGDRAG